MEEEIAQPPADPGQGLHTLLFVNNGGKQAVGLHGKQPLCANYQPPGKISRGEKLMETAKKAFCRGRPGSPSSGVRRAACAFTAGPRGAFADTRDQCERGGERSLHPVQQTFPTQPSSSPMPAKARHPLPKVTARRKHPRDAEDAGDGLVGLWRCRGHVTDSVVGHQTCPQVGSEHMVGSGLCLPRARPGSTAGRDVLKMLLF